jgi:hypothetical protein
MQTSAGGLTERLPSIICQLSAKPAGSTAIRQFQGLSDADVLVLQSIHVRDFLHTGTLQFAHDAGQRVADDEPCSGVRLSPPAQAAAGVYATVGTTAVCRSLARIGHGPLTQREA